MQKAAVLLVEHRHAEVALACAAIALHRPEAEVLEAADIRAAMSLLRKEPAALRLAILGERAMARAEKLIAALDRKGLEVPVVGLAAGVSEPAKRQALDCGVRSVYERPREWPRYAELMERLLDEWL
jgi:DNA-binding NtrC family response regulator